jgi:hypothetical protein
MKFSLFLAAALLFGAPVVATPSPGDTREAEILSELCDEGFNTACRKLATVTKGNCAAPLGSGCRYDSGIFVPVKPQELMVLVPGLEFLGLSRISSVEFCQKQTGARSWLDLQTDSDLEKMLSCLSDST